MNRLSLTTLLFLTLLSPLAARADIQLPMLSGRVVDQAQRLKAEERFQLTELIQQYERRSGHRLVVATVPKLQGVTIEEYAQQLIHNWKLGKKGKDNGVLFLIAPNDRKIRIEVGYGLESALTEALAANIIYSKVLPEFRRGDFSGGINAGVQSIIAATKNEYVAEPLETREEQRIALLVGLFLLLIMLHLFISAALGSPIQGRLFKRGRYGGYYGTGGFGGSLSSGDPAGRFSGGGGGFGGGGASGGW
ncbi:TPM domain-containing protein [Microbulbifer sp. SSSA002]|uniref:TPM domain-containing protein n=1 Tax=Microbulbifer sp. SSSA002 TaxID=3243376 RepID=UPI0040398057